LDYRTLLIKYINHVGLCEGLSFIECYEFDMVHHGLTEEEIAELKKLDKEGINGLRSGSS
jgi:hypothetical protein